MAKVSEDTREWCGAGGTGTWDLISQVDKELHYLQIGDK